jgi:hypothetical protein
MYFAKYKPTNVGNTGNIPPWLDPGKVSAHLTPCCSFFEFQSHGHIMVPLCTENFYHPKTYSHFHSSLVPKPATRWGSTLCSHTTAVALHIRRQWHPPFPWGKGSLGTMALFLHNSHWHSACQMEDANAQLLKESPVFHKQGPKIYTVMVFHLIKK